MITVDEALALVLQHSRLNLSERVALASSLNRVLAADVASDIDSPPYDKAMVDGYAVLSADLADGHAELDILEEVTAGDVPTHEVSAGEATRIMTGAPMPPGPDAVVMIERTTVAGAGEGGLGRVTIDDAPPRPGQNVMPRATVMRRGETVLAAGHKIAPAEIGLLAEMGASEVDVIRLPSVAVLATGDELVPAGEMPAPGQIRNSNGPMLLAAVARAGGVPVDLGIGRDDSQQLRALVERGLEAEILILSGGVSAGVLDLVPDVLASAGVAQVFHKVRLKPGKPLWFGRLPSEPVDKLVFGLPGNPVSSLVCCELFVRPAIAKMGGAADEGAAIQSARLTADHAQRGDRPTYHPGRLHTGAEAPTVDPLRWLGSADLRSLAAANALICFPAGDRRYGAGEAVDVLRLG